MVVSRPASPSPPTGRIEKVWAFVMTADDGTEGVAGMVAGPCVLPMVVTDEARIVELLQEARKAARANGRRIVLAEFSHRADTWEFR